MKTNTGGDESNRSRYWVSGEAHTASVGLRQKRKKKKEEEEEPTGK